MSDLAAEKSTWPRFLIFDANVFLDLAKVPGNAPVLRAIEKAVRKGDEFKLLIPEPVITAIAANRERAVKAHWDLRRQSLKNMKLYLRDLTANPATFDGVAQSIDTSIRTNEKALPDTVAAMDELLAAGTVVNCEDRHFSDAGRRFIAKRAPAHERRNKDREHISILKDCLIWAIIREKCAETHTEFVTNDTDFTSPTQNDKLHEDLASEVKGRLKFHTLSDFIQVHIKEHPVIVPGPPLFLHEPGGYKTCPICGSDQIGEALIPRHSQYGGLTYQQYCPGHGGYVDTGEFAD